MAKVTIQQVAQAAGVSKGTVSRVLNGRDDVNATTRRQVLGVVERLGYVPDPGARKLARGERHVVGIASYNDEPPYGPYYMILLDAIQEAFLGEGYTARLLEPARGGLPADAADGLILLGIHIDDPRPDRLRAAGTPFAVVGEAASGAAWVDVDNAGGTRQVVEHLVKLGHRRVVHLGGAPTGQAAHERLAAHLSVLRASGFPEDRRLVLDGGFTELGGYRAIRRALAQGLEFSAVAAASDEMALGAIAALEDAGLRVPWDVSVTGFDDLPFAARSGPPLTTVRQPIRDVGRCAARLLLDRLAGRPARGEILPVRLVVRSTTARHVGPGP